MASVHDMKRAYKGEWLAIAVLKQGPSGPEEGDLIYHAKNENEVWQRIKDDRRRIYVTYAGPLLEEGYAAAF